MVQEARLEDVGSGLAPVTPGWFVVNAGDAAGCGTTPSAAAACSRAAGASSRSGPSANRSISPRPASRWRCSSPEADGHVPRRVEPGGLPRAGGRVPAGHRGAGAAAPRLGLRPLPARTSHTFVGTGDEPCVIFMTARGARRHDPLSALGDGAGRGAGVETETGSPREAYAPFAAGGSAGPARGPVSPGAEADSVVPVRGSGAARMCAVTQGWMMNASRGPG